MYYPIHGTHARIDGPESDERILNRTRSLGRHSIRQILLGELGDNPVEKFLKLPRFFESGFIAG
jgi:hypothetical protein